ncbi:CHASE3 domain-containing protein [Methylocella sp.]|uniref:CHASE3 domain-containing protein n=1 Tax=Methylocella sp. TaxID=1978226 RepID=UPI0035AFEA21
MPMSLRKRSVAPILIVLLLLLGVIVAAIALVSLLESDQAKVRASLELEVKTAELGALLRDAETGQRGYLLTGRTSYLEPYEAATRNFAALSEPLRRPTGDPAMARDIQELETVVGLKFAELKRIIDLTANGDRNGARLIVETDEGKRLMDRARELIERIKSRQQALLDERLANTLRTANLARWGVVCALLLTLALGARILRDGWRLVTATALAEAQTAAANVRIREEMRQKEALEAQLRQSQKLEAIGQLTGGVAHDFNNMLAVVIGALNLMKRRLERGEANVMKFVDAALDGAQRGAALTHRLLAFARQQPLAPQPVDCNAFIAGMSDLLRRTLGDAVRVETVLSGGLWRARVDPSELESALLNLAVNARDAMPGGGRLTIETANAFLDDPYAARHIGVRAGQYVLVSVTDTGSGMTPEVVARAFDPFFTTKSAGKGTGLGLSQVFGFVKQSDGHIKIYTEDGEGTSMKIYLPRYFGEAIAPAPAPSDDAALPLGAPEIVVLVVEDEERLLRMSAEAFRDLGYTAVEAGDPLSALRILDERDDVALMFTDVVMPEMNGRKLAEAAIARRPGLRVIYTTGFSRNAVVHNGVLDHDVDFLPKPFTLEQLARKARAALSRKV